MAPIWGHIANFDVIRRRTKARDTDNLNKQNGCPWTAVYG